MVEFASFMEALGSYIDTEIVQKAPRDRRMSMGVVALAAPMVLTRKANENAGLLRDMGLVDESMAVDVDALEDFLSKLMDRYGPYRFEIPKPFGGLSVELTKDDVARFCQTCRNIGG